MPVTHPREPISTRRTIEGPLADRAILALLAGGAPLQEVLDELVLAVERQSDGMVGSILFVEGGVVRHASAPHLAAGYLAAIDGQAIGPVAGSCGTAAWRREPVIVEDIATDPLWAPYRSVALGHGLRACWSVPIFAQGEVVGTFALYYAHPRRPTPELLELTRHASHLAAIAIERSRREAALVESEARLSLVYRHVEDGLFHLEVLPGEQYRFVSVNPAFTRATGLRAEQVVGRRLEEILPPSSLAAARKHYAEAVASHATVRWEDTGTAKGGPWTGEVAVTPVYDEQGVARSLVGSVRDVTEHRRLEEELRQLHKMEAVGSLTGGVAHDFNNLLTVILGHAELVLGSLPADAPQRQDVEAIAEAGDRAAALTRQLLAFARKQALQPRRLDLGQVVHGLERMLRRLIRENIRFELALAPDLWPVMADPGQIEQVLVNLAVNARDAIAEAGTIRFETSNVTLPQTTSELPGGDYVRLAVTDDGAGMDEPTLRRAFEPFFTTKPKGMGTGLGLSTVYGIVKQSGGRVTLRSAPGEGTTVEVLLPRAEHAPEAAPEPSAPAEVAPVGGRRVLLVEDEPALRSLCMSMLQTLGCEVTVAPSAEEALRRIGEGLRPDLLISDLLLPGMNGRQLAERLRAARPELPVVFVSGYSDQPFEESGPGTVFLPKPFQRPALAAAVRKALAGG